MANFESPTISYDLSVEPAEPADMTFEQMYAAYYDSLVGFMKYKYPNLPESEHAEVIQDGMIKAMTHYDEYQDTGFSRKAWLYQIIKRTALDRLRANGRRTAEPSSDMHQFENYVDTNTDADFANVEYHDILDHVAKVLTDKDVENGWYATFYLYAVKDMTYDAIAATLGLERGTVASRINRIRKRLILNTALREYANQEPLESKS